MKRLNKFLDILEKICMEICVILLLVISLSILYQVIVRKLGYSVTWVDETARYAMILLVFVGTIPITRRGEHIRILSFVEMLPPKIRKVTETVTYLIVTAAALVFSYCCFYAASTVGSVRFSMLTFITMEQFYYLLSGIGLLIAFMVIMHIAGILTDDTKKEGREDD